MVEEANFGLIKEKECLVKCLDHHVQVFVKFEAHAP